MTAKVRVNTEWLSDCGGCHVGIVDLHEKILELFGAVELQHCPVLTDIKDYPPADIGILTGAIRSQHDIALAKKLRASCKVLIAFGTCAVHGGIPGAALAHDRQEILDAVYVHNRTTRTHAPPTQKVTPLAKLVTPVDEVVAVDLYLPGCPPHAAFIVDALFALLEGRTPKANDETVCARCERTMAKTDTAALKKNHDGIPQPDLCLLSQGYLCLGSVTLDRCMAPCTGAGVPCTGCAGPTRQILTEPNRDLRTEVADRMASLTAIPRETIVAAIERGAKSHYAYAMANPMIGGKPTFLIRQWIAAVEETPVTTIAIDPVTRIEGHARVFLDLADDGTVADAGLVVNELRGFERILVGMEADRMPLVTARICGVCPTAHHVAAARALDAAAGVTPPPAAERLRELLYMGHVIHSHALSLFVLQGPDLVLGLDAPAATRNVVGLVQAAPEIGRKALRLRSLGQHVNELVGGRGVHPVTVVAGGIAFSMDEAKRAKLAAWIDEALALCAELVPFARDRLLRLVDERPALGETWVVPSWYQGTVQGGLLRFTDGRLRVMDAEGAVRCEFDAADYADHLVEAALDWSYMKPVYFKDGDAERVFRVGTLARLNCADRLGTPLADAALDDLRARFGRPAHQTVLHTWARAIELLYCAERARELLDDPAIFGETRVPVTFEGRRGVGHVEAARGTLIHDYVIDDQGIVRQANLIVATQQNYSAINQSIRQAVGDVKVAGSDEAVLNTVEFAIRCYDPCLSCATHAYGRMPLDVVVRRGGEVVRRVRRDL